MRGGSAVCLSVVMVLSVVAGSAVAPAAATGGSGPAGETVAEARAGPAAADLRVDARPLALGSDVPAQTDNESGTNRAPTAAFNATPAEPAPGESVAFDATDSVDPDGEVVAYEWTVDGESVADGPTAEYTFETAEDHTVRLTVTDDDNGTASLTQVVPVSVREESETGPVSESADPEQIPEFETEKPSADPVIPFLSGPVELEAGLDPAVTDTGRERAWAVVQFRYQPAAEDLDFLQSLGYQQRSVLADRTYYAALPPENAPEAIELESVRAIAPVDPVWKLPPEFDRRVAERADAEFRVIVRSFEAIPERADSLGLERIRERTYRGTLTATQVRDLQQRETVRWIEPFDEPEPLLAESVAMAGAQRSEFPVDGSGVRVGVVDTGIEHGHPHFSGVTIVDSYDKNDDDYYPEADNFNWSGNDHGTHVAGTIAGRSTYRGDSLVGVAPEATLVVARGLGGDQFDRVHENGTDIISNSWGSRPFTGRYSSDDAFADEWARDHPQSVLVAANGNWNASNPREQFAGTPAIGKNVISVGALNDGSRFTDALNNVAWLNNMTGPNDGRQKPDINAPGARITSSVLNSTYGTKVGTSMATPHVSGVAALYEDEYPNRNPDAAEVKAAMVATAGPVQNPNPSERAEGYGAIDAHNMLYNNSYESRQIHYYGTLAPPFGTATTHKFNVSGDAEKVVVSLSWLDPPGDPATTDTLVNDLDLYVGPTSDPKRYSVTERNQSVNRLTVDSLSSSERGTEWTVTVEPHNMWTGAGADKPSQDYDGKIRVVTEKPEISVDVPDRITVEPQRRVTESFEARVDATGAPVHGIRAFVESDSALQDCFGSKAHDEEHVIGTLSESYRSDWSEQLCFDVPDEAGTYPVTTTVNYTSPAGQTATIEKETVIEVPRPRVKLEPFERNITVGETTTYELVVGNLSGGVSEYETYISLDRPPIGGLTDFTVTGTPSSETVQMDSSSDRAWISVEADGLDTTDYGTATLGVLEAEGSQVGKSNLSVEVSTLDDESGDAYSLRTQGITLDPAVPSDGLLNVTRGPIDSGGITIEPPPIDPDNSSIVTVDIPITIQLDQEAIVSEYDAEPAAVEWDFGDGATATGLTTTHTYAEPGTYEIVGVVVLEDDRTVDISRTVEVASESGDAGNDTKRVVLEPGSATVTQGGTTSVDLVLTNADRGVGTYDPIVIEVSDGSVASLVGASSAVDSASASLLGETRVEFAGAFGEGAAGPGDVTLGTIQVAGASAGTAGLAVNATGSVFTRNGREYTLAGTSDGSVTVRQRERGPEVVAGTPAVDTDGNGLLDDFNGNGVVDRGDAQALFANLESQQVSENAALLDYNGNGAVDRGDVQAVFQRARG